MANYVLLTAMLLSTVLADTSASWGGITVSWDISGSNVEFTVVVTKDTIDSGSTWWGFGINSSSSMAGADIYMIYKDGSGSNRVVDSTASSNSSPTTDSTSHVTVSSHTTNGDGTMTTVFTRPLDTGDTS